MFFKPYVYAPFSLPYVEFPTLTRHLVEIKIAIPYIKETLEAIGRLLNKRDIGVAC